MFTTSPASVKINDTLSRFYTRPLLEAYGNVITLDKMVKTCITLYTMDSF